MQYTEDLTDYTTENAVEDIELFVDSLSEADLLEHACVNPEESLKVSIREALRDAHANPARARLRVLWSTSGKPLLIGGWDAWTGVAWFLTTVHAKDHPVQTLKGILECRDTALEECPQLLNVMMKTNTYHVALLERIGAEFVGPITSIGGEPFQAFVIQQQKEVINV